MLPVIAIVGRPNVGKSTLFNCITKSKAALVADFPGVTRDRQYGKACYQHKSFMVVDTSGLGELDSEVDSLASQQAELAILSQVNFNNLALVILIVYLLPILVESMMYLL